MGKEEETKEEQSDVEPLLRVAACAFTGGSTGVEPTFVLALLTAYRERKESHDSPSASRIPAGTASQRQLGSEIQ